jgi:hypothetical protein
MPHGAWSTVKKRRLYLRLVKICQEALLDDDYDDSDNEDGDELDDLLEFTYELGQSISRTLESTGRQNNGRSADPLIPIVRRGKKPGTRSRKSSVHADRYVASRKGQATHSVAGSGTSTVVSYTSESVIEDKGNGPKKT